MAAKQQPRETSNLPIDYAEQLSKESQDITKRIQSSGGSKIRSSGNRVFILPGGVESPEIEGVIVDFTAMNTYYDRPFDRDNPTPPACYAIGTVPSQLVPPKDVPDRQADNCVTCPLNQFGTALSGKGKACSNKRVLALLPIDDVEGEIMTLDVPPGSIQSFDSYVAGLSAKHKTVPIGVITKVKLDPGQQYFSPRFEVVRPTSNAELGGFMGRRDEAQKIIATPPDTSSYEPAKKPGAARKR